MRFEVRIKGRNKRESKANERAKMAWKCEENKKATRVEDVKGRSHFK